MKHRGDQTKAGEIMQELMYGEDGRLSGRPVRGWRIRMTALFRCTVQRSLNPIVFPEEMLQEGLSLAALLAMPRQELIGVVPDYRGLRTGDIVTVLMFHRGLHRTVKAGSMCVCHGDAPLTFRFNRPMLEQFGENGRIDFMYEVRSASGDVALRCAAVTLDVAVHDMPERLPAPVVLASQDGVVRETDIVPEMVVAIPSGVGGCKPGDRLRLRLGDAWFEPMTLGSMDVGRETIAHFLVSCDDILRLASMQPSETFTLDVSFDLERHGTLSPSDVGKVRFDLGESDIPCEPLSS
ncbi:hypothetical protein [Luteibacter aegosomatissinici]|uniref:hypothetical protein n=1 Tax=Luteibacter aegosomatissinici TaxID=2911539 RepID=UPI001FFAEC67|nr:hypothetical protein [Luteibacter aegosomatissinici]UPG96420.1 hypothetical protein L2Y97_10005 [Luteibacter aegosomatissinici]